LVLVIDDGPLRRLAADQHGLVARHQCAEVDVDPRQWQRIADGRRWERRTPRVLGLVGAADTRAQRAMLAVLEGGPGACLSSTSAAAWWGIPGNLLEPWQVIWQRGHVRRPQRVAARHEPVLVPDHHVVRLEGVPVVTPARALFEVAGTRRRGAELPWWVERMCRMVDSAWSLRLVSGATLHDMLDDLASRGRPGIRVMRQVLAERPNDYVPPASALESRVAQILASAGLPKFRRQIDTGDGQGWIGRVDFRAVDLPVILEVQSERFHTSLIDQQLDGRRLTRLRAAGFVVAVIVEPDVWHRPDRLITQAREALATASAARSSLSRPLLPRTRRHFDAGTGRNVDGFAGVGVSSGWRRRRSRRRT
jgi:hypothetical protein